MIQKLLRATAIIAISFFFSGCFVRLPMRGSPEQRMHFGATVPTRMEFDVFTQGDGNVAIDPAVHNVGSAQHKLATLPKGTLVTVKGMAFRILPWRNEHYFVCRARKERLTFDIPTYDADRFVDWCQTSLAPNEQRIHSTRAIPGNPASRH